jgi:hypothetical protein
MKGQPTLDQQLEVEKHFAAVVVDFGRDTGLQAELPLEQRLWIGANFRYMEQPHFARFLELLKDPNKLSNLSEEDMETFGLFFSLLAQTGFLLYIRNLTPEAMFQQLKMQHRSIEMLEAQIRRRKTAKKVGIVGVGLALLVWFIKRSR